MIIKQKFLPLLLCLAFIFTSCSAQPTASPVDAQVQTLSAELTSTVPPTAIPMPTATEVPPRSLVICLEQEPASLYLYGSSSRSTSSVLESIYDGPFDVINYEPQPVILEKMPAYTDGDALFQPISMNAGDLVVDINGNLVSLAAGMQVQPAGCTSLDCAVTWDGISPLQMDQEVVTFTLKPNIAWSDGVLLSAEDSVYSFQVAGDVNTPVSHQLVYRTQTYSALDAAHVQWIGVPGFFPERLDTIFWSPLPKHLWGGITPAELVTSEMSSKYPIGWGPYIIEEWVNGDHIRLKKNAQYFRAPEGLPAFDFLVYRFLGEQNDSLLAALQSKECDVIDHSSSLESQLSEIQDLENQGVLKTHITAGPEWEQLVFGIDHVTYDDGFSPWSGDRPDFFSDVRTRQAFAYCIDRQSIADDLLKGLSYIPATYLPETHPQQDPDAARYAFDPEAGRQLLNQIGWWDWDGIPETPLQSVGIPTILDGTFFRITYTTTQAVLRQQIAEMIKGSLGECGIEVDIHTITPDEMFAGGAEGVLFGRNFDLAQFAWNAGVLPPCQFFASSQIPRFDNNWLSLNIGGYQNYVFDTACQASLVIRPDLTEAYSAKQREAQHIFANELPVIPLYMRLKIALARSDFCGFSTEISSQKLFWNLEELDYGDGCQP